MAALGDVLNIGSDVLGIGEGVAQFVTGLKKEKQDDLELSQLKRPFYKIQDEYVQNRNLAANSAETGLPSATKKYLTSENQKGLSASFATLMQGGGSPNDIAKLFNTYSSSLNQTAAQDAAAHLENIQYFMSANKDLAGQKNIQFGINELQPYENKLKELTERKAADETTKWGGIGTAIGSTGAAGTSLSNADLYKMLFGTGNPSGTTGKVSFSSVDKPSVDTPNSVDPSIANPNPAGFVAPSVAPRYNGIDMSSYYNPQFNI